MIRRCQTKPAHDALAPAPIPTLMNTSALGLLCFVACLGSLAGMEESYSTGGVDTNYLRTSGNSPAQIQAEVNSRSLALELLCNLGIDLEKAPKVKCTVEFQIVNDQSFKVKGFGISGLDESTALKFERMIMTYINSRVIGMTRAVSTVRTLLIHAPAKKSETDPAAPMSNAAAFAKAYDLPFHMIRPITELNFVLGDDPKFAENFLFEDGDIAIFCSITPKDQTPLNCMLIDRRLVENPAVLATFKRIQPAIQRRRLALMDELELSDRPDKETVARELKLFWRATRETFASLGIQLLPTDQMRDFWFTISIK